MPDPFVVLVAAVAAIAGIVIGFLARRVLSASSVKHAEHYSERLVAEARAKQKEIVLEGKDEALRMRRAAEEEGREQRATQQRTERRLLDREEALDRKVAAFEQREESLRERQQELDTELVRLRELHQRQLGELERVSGLSASEAREGLISQIVDEAQAEAQHRVRDIERHATEEGEDRARRVLTTVMQRIAADHTSEATITVVALPNEERRGATSGRAGANTRSAHRAASRRGGAGTAAAGSPPRSASHRRRTHLRRHQPRPPNAEPRDEGPHHRPRGTQHPRARAGHGRRPHHRRHPRG